MDIHVFHADTKAENEERSKFWEVGLGSCPIAVDQLPTLEPIVSQDTGFACRKIEGSCVQACGSGGRHADRILLLLHKNEGWNLTEEAWNAWPGAIRNALVVVLFSGGGTCSVAEGLPLRQVIAFDGKCRCEGVTSDQQERFLAFKKHIENLPLGVYPDKGILNVDVKQEVLTKFAALGMLLQGALTILGAERGEPWAWCPSEWQCPAPALDMEVHGRIAEALAALKKAPSVWFAEAREDLAPLFLNGVSNEGFKCLVGRNETVESTCRNRLWIDDDNEGALLLVAKATVRAGMPGVTGDPLLDLCSQESLELLLTGDPLLNFCLQKPLESLLMKAFKEYVIICNELCG